MTRGLLSLFKKNYKYLDNYLWVFFCLFVWNTFFLKKKYLFINQRRFLKMENFDLERIFKVSKKKD